MGHSIIPCYVLTYYAALKNNHYYRMWILYWVFGLLGKKYRTHIGTAFSSERSGWAISNCSTGNAWLASNFCPKYLTTWVGKWGYGCGCIKLPSVGK